MKKILWGLTKAILPYTLEKPIDNLIEKIESKEKTRDSIFLESSNAQDSLIIIRDLYTWTEKYKIFDRNQKLKYEIKGDFFSIKHSLNIFDSNKQKIGMIKEKIFTFRSLIISRRNVIDTEFIISGKKIGCMKSIYSFGLPKYKLDFNDWKITRESINSNYKVTHNDKPIMEMKSKLTFDDKKYYLEINDQNEELTCLLIALTLDVSSSRKRDDFMRTFHHNFI